jgi:hypothetical protein
VEKQQLAEWRVWQVWRADKVEEWITVEMIGGKEEPGENGDGKLQRKKWLEKLKRILKGKIRWNNKWLVVGRTWPERSKE